MKIKKLTALRRTSQIFFFSLFVYILWSTTYPLKGLLPTKSFFLADPLVMLFISLSERIVLPGILTALLVLGLTLILGRFFCGWVCPLGAMLDFFGWLNRSRDRLKSRNFVWIRNVKFYFLLLIAILAAFGIQLAWGLDPLVITARFVSLNFIPAVTSGMDHLLIALIRATNHYEPLLDFYHWLSASLLGVKIHYFSHAFITLGVVLLVLGTVFLSRRFWCRAVCPLGALYALIAKYAWQKRVRTGCVFCGKCPGNCRMAAISEDSHYDSGECILCMDCVYDCPQQITRFKFAGGKTGKPGGKDPESGISRRQFLGLLGTAGAALAAGILRKRFPGIKPVGIIRPPGALVEKDFLDRCIRCGNCMKVCPTNGLQPIMFAAGCEGIWTPRLAADIGYCEYTCTLCSQVCPTGAIHYLGLKKKQKTRIGVARIDRNLCLPWAKKKECIVCEEQCPVPKNAVKLKKERIEGKIVLRPYIDEKLCIGCGICQTKCPVDGIRAVKVFPFIEDRVKV